MTILSSPSLLLNLGGLAPITNSMSQHVQLQALQPLLAQAEGHALPPTSHPIVVATSIIVP